MGILKKYRERQTHQSFNRLKKLREMREREEGNAEINREIIEERERILKAREVNERAKPLKKKNPVNRFVKSSKELIGGFQDLGKMMATSPRKKGKKRKQEPMLFNPFGKGGNW
jgi:hypothetical protein